MKKYTISFTENQLRTIARGLEFYSRFLAGQWEIPDAMEFKEYENQGKSDEFWNIRNEVEDEFRNLKSKFTKLHINEFYGIGSSKMAEDANIAYDIYKPIWCFLKKESDLKDKSEGKTPHWSVYDSIGLSYSSEGHIKIGV